MEGGRRLDVAWRSAAPGLGERDRGWVHEAVFGTIRLRGRLDHLLDRHLDRGLLSVPAPLLPILRLGAYQILCMLSVPSYAAVSQATEQATTVGGSKGGGLVNAVLRALDRTGADPTHFPDSDEDPVGYLSTWGSHPRWLVERWIDRFGAAEARGIVEAGNTIPEVFLRPVGLGTERAARDLAAEGLEVSDGPEGSRTLRLPPGSDPKKALTTVRGIIQDPAAAEAANLVRVKPGETVADLCAAPGGKGIALMDSGAWVVASDRSLGRLRRMQPALQRLNLPQRLIVARAEAPPFREVDIVLVDAPCTGTGTLSRHPDIRWRLTPRSPGEMARVQFQIMEGAARIVRPGGVLIYSTCTLEAEENEDLVNSFLKAREDFASDEGEEPLRILPGERSKDGAFATRLRRIE